MLASHEDVDSRFHRKPKREDRMDIGRRVLDFWFGPADSPGYGTARAVWFESDSAFDAEVRQRFGAAIEPAAQGDLDGIAANAEGALALIILLDQFPRNVYRGTARAFAHDARARSVAHDALAAGHDRALAQQCSSQRSGSARPGPALSQAQEGYACGYRWRTHRP